MPSANEFLNSSGVPSAKFTRIGDSVSGLITDEPELRQQRDYATGELLTWDNGEPRWQVIVHVQTDDFDGEVEDDDGVRAVYIKGQMMSAVRSAMRRAKVKELQAGGHLTITYVRDGEPPKRGFNAPKVYEAAYKPPAAPVSQVLQGDDSPPF
jgi:hypothetical protein